MEIPLELGFFLSSLIQGLSGFGAAIGMNAFLTRLFSLQMVSPAVAGLSLVLNLTILLLQKRKIGFVKELWGLVGWSLVGIPFGIGLLQFLPDMIAKYCIAILIITMMIFQGRSHAKHIAIKGNLLHGVAFLAGMLGFAYNVNGLFIAIYVLSKNMEKSKSILLSASYFLIMNCINIAIFYGRGFYHEQTLDIIKIGFLPLVLGGILGSLLMIYIPKRLFDILIRGFLVIAVLLLLL